MPKIEPGVYEPSDDVRVFDDSDDVDEEGSRLPLLIVIALLVLSAFGGVVYLAYTQGVQRGRADAPRTIVADQGTNATPYKGLKIYDQPVPADQDSADADSAPPPPTVKPNPAPASTMTAQVPPRTKPPVIAVTPKPTPIPGPGPVLASPPKAKPVEAAPAPVESAPAPPVETAPSATAPPAASASGSYVLQIGAYKSEDEANAAWKTYQAKHPAVGGSDSDVKKADLGDKGIWYRLRIGSFATKDAASALCDKLKADGAACMLAKK